MKMHRSGDVTNQGIYISVWPPDCRFVGAPGEALDGREGLTYRRVPAVLALLLSPLFGGAFVLLFPVLVILGTGLLATTLAARAIRSLLERHWYLASARWEPVTAYLNRCEPKRGGEGQGRIASEALERLEKEVQVRRAEEKEQSK